MLLGASAAVVAAAALGAHGASAQSPADAAGASLANFPLAATQITLAKFNARGSSTGM
jgi:hypothetical protein